MMTIVKLDLCGSKNFFERHRHRRHVRRDTLSQLLDRSAAIFPNSQAQYPNGSRYATQGDCVYYILDDPTVAVRCTIDFLREWASMSEVLPDCRAVIDTGLIEENSHGARTDLISPAFDNISVIEKHYGPGEIGVTDLVARATDRSLVNFIRRKETPVTSERRTISWLANYENPRLLHDSSLVHALFVASKNSATVRDRTYEAVIVECVMDRIDGRASPQQIQDALEEKQCPTISDDKLREIVQESDYLDHQQDYIGLSPAAGDRLNTIRSNLQDSRDSFVRGVAERFSARIGVTPEVIQSRLDIAELLERYICAVFLELRFMASYLVATQHVFDSDSSFSDFDYILVQRIGKKLAHSNEEFLFFKRAFLDSIREALTSSNAYVASVFHNVLMLYYLNRNERYIHDQIATIRKKQIYLDTNTLYAYMCRASEHHSLVDYALQKLGAMGVKPIVFDQSVREYNNSLASVATIAGRARTDWVALEYDPWILQEYKSDQAAYNNNLSYCIDMHRIPAGDVRASDDLLAVESALRDKNIMLERLQPYLSEVDLGAVYQHVYEAKQVFDPHLGGMIVKGSLDTYHEKVLHDANCLYHLSNEGSNPYELTKMFVTCDYRLAKVRRMQRGYDCVVTIREFYEFMLPYLLLSDTISSDPVDIPRFLLASAISLELASTKTLESVVSDFLARNQSVSQDYRILARSENRARFDEIRLKLEPGERGISMDAATQQRLLSDLGHAIGAYKDAVRDSVGRSVSVDGIRNRDKRISELEAELDDANRKLSHQDRKQGRRRRYERAQSRREGR